MVVFLGVVRLVSLLMVVGSRCPGVVRLASLLMVVGGVAWCLQQNRDRSAEYVCNRGEGASAKTRQ